MRNLEHSEDIKIAPSKFSQSIVLALRIVLVVYKALIRLVIGLANRLTISATTPEVALRLIAAVFLSNL